MNKRSLEWLYNLGAKIIIIAIPFLFLWIDKGSFFPYVAPRTFLFRFLVEIALALGLAGLVLKGKIKEKFSLLTFLVLGFLAVIGVADFFGNDPFLSFWSRMERMDGYLNLIHLVLFFLAIKLVFNNKKDWLCFFYSIITVSIVEFFYAVLQKIGKIETIIGGFRAEGTFGNPAYLGAFALLSLGLAVMLAVEEKESFKKWLLVFAAVINLITMFLTATRGIFVGLSFGVVVFAAIMVFSKTESVNTKAIKKISLIILAVLVLFLGGIFIFRNTKLVAQNETLNRISSISLTDRTTLGRFLVWEVALEGVKERPILGWGQDNFINVFNKYYDPGLYNQEMWFDRAHNSILDWTIAGGVLGAVFYLAIFFLAGRLIIKSIKKETEEKKTGKAVLLSVLGAYFVQNLFIFDNLTTYVFFFSIIAYADYREKNEEREEILEGRESLSLIIFSVLVISSLTFSWFINLKPYLQARKVISSINLMYEKATVGGVVLKSFQDALEYNTFGNEEVVEQFGKVINEILMTPRGDKISLADKKEFVKETVEKMRKEIERRPDNLRIRLFLGTIYTRFSEYDKDYLELGNKELREALKISPKKQQIYFALIENYLRGGNYEKALTVAQAAYELEKNYVAARGNLAYVAVLNGKDSLVDELVKEGMTAQFLSKVSDGYIILKKYDKALEIAKLTVKAEDDDADYRVKLAGLYLNQGMAKEAIQEAKMAMSLNPKKYEASVKEFLENVKKLGYKVE